MKGQWKHIFIWTVLLCFAPALALAQAASCPDIVQTALDAADQLCANTGRNQACYGNVDLSAQPQPGAKNFSFNKAGDIVDVGDIQSLTLSPMNEVDDKWGVALLRLQANLPDTIPGQNVTFLLYGDVEITNAVEPGDTTQHPMQAFLLRTGTHDSACDEAPESGLLVQTPEGAEEISFNVNGVDVQMGSTVLFQADANNGMSISTLEGAAFVAAEDGVQLIPPGARSRVRLGRNLRALGAPENPESYEDRLPALRALPLRLLQRRVTAAPPLNRAQMQLMRERLSDGELPCGDQGLPTCARLRQFLQNSINFCASKRPAERPRFCVRLRNFIQKLDDREGSTTNPIATPFGLLTPGAFPTNPPAPPTITPTAPGG